MHSQHSLQNDWRRIWITEERRKSPKIVRKKVVKNKFRFLLSLIFLWITWSLLIVMFTVYSCPDLATFVEDMDYMSDLIANGNLKSDCYRWAATAYLSHNHRIRINTEETTKVVAAALGTELIKFLAHASFFAVGQFEEWDELHRDDLKKRMNSSYTSKSSKCNIACMARNWINYYYALFTAAVQPTF